MRRNCPFKNNSMNINRNQFKDIVLEWWKGVGSSEPSTLDVYAFVRDFIDNSGKVVVNKDDEPYRLRTLELYAWNLIRYGSFQTPSAGKKKARQKPEEMLKTDRQLISAKEDVRLLSKKYKAAIDALEEKDAQVRAYEATSAISNDIVHIEPKMSGNKSESTAFLLLSDWHLEESVDPDTVYGLNEYTIDICHQRLVKVCQNALKVIQAQRHNEQIKNLVLWFGGDLITGYIHEELMEENLISPTQATMKAEELMCIVIEFFSRYGGFDEIRIVCSPGNHGRTTKKIRVSTGYKNSFEWMAYNNVARHMGVKAPNTDLNWTIAKSLYTYVEVYDKINRFWHGDNIRYQGGIGGVTVLLIKAIHRANETIKANYNFMGHFHTWIHPPGCTINGSLIGWGAYADRIGAPKEEPVQGLQLLSKQYGYTLKIPIYCK